MIVGARQLLPAALSHCLLPTDPPIFLTDCLPAWLAGTCCAPTLRCSSSRSSRWPRAAATPATACSSSFPRRTRQTAPPWRPPTPGSKDATPGAPRRRPPMATTSGAVAARGSGSESSRQDEAASAGHATGKDPPTQLAPPAQLPSCPNFACTLPPTGSFLMKIDCILAGRFTSASPSAYCRHRLRHLGFNQPQSAPQFCVLHLYNSIHGSTRRRLCLDGAVSTAGQVRGFQGIIAAAPTACVASEITSAIAENPPGALSAQQPISPRELPPAAPSQPPLRTAISPTGIHRQQQQQ